jgi:hypothetical protein
MLYRAQTSPVTTVSGEQVLVSPTNFSQNDLGEYFKKIKENKNSTFAEQTLLLSQSGFADFQDLPRSTDVIILQNLVQSQLPAVTNSSTTITVGPQSGNQIPSVVGEGVGMIGGAIGKIAGAGAK